MNEYVTVVQVDIQQPKIAFINEPKLPPPSSFVTVLSINNGQNNTMTINTSEKNDSEIVTVYRLPGERLGFGLKFKGGTKTNEQVERLFIQSCDADSPASRARASWGALGEGDEILEIDNEPITKMTRIECVKCLKDRNVAINLLVRKADRNSMTIVRNDSFNGGNKRPLPPPPSPPKVPPRKIVSNKKPPPVVPTTVQVAPIVAAKLVETPVAAENYLNSLDDDSISMNFNDESDETGSTISSQISVISNFSSESDLSLLSTANASSDLTRILTKPFQMIEREFNVNGNGNGGNKIPIDNLLLFNDLDQPNNSYANVVINEGMRYENVDTKKLPPTPLPRGSISTISSTQDKHSGNVECEINSKTPTKTIESWLDATINRSGNDKTSSDSALVQSYEPIKFEYFASVDDEEEKLGPSSELLNISEAYFNFPWCANVSNALQLETIGEAEEEFSSMEQQQRVNTGPIFIVQGDDDTDSKQQDIHRNSMEINNNINSPYLHTSEDKSDNLTEENMKIIHNESRNIPSTDESSSQEIKLPSKSSHSSDCNKDIIMATASDIDVCERSHNEHVTKSIEVNKVHENIIHSNEVLIKSDSEFKDVEERVEKTFKEEIFMTQSEIKTEKTSATTTSQSSVYNTTNVLISDEKMDQPQLFSLNQKPMKEEDNSDKSRMQADEKEITSVNRTTITSTKTIINSKNDNISTTNDFNSSKISQTTKATAIVAPQRKTYNFDEITNFTDSKPPFKSATLGRPTRPTLNWRNKDEKSEKSVKDKIAMFSNSTSDISLIIPKQTYKDRGNGNGSMRNNAKSIENIFASDAIKPASRVSSKKKAMSMENLDDYTDDVEIEEEVKTYTPVSKPVSSYNRPPLLSMNRAQSVEHLMSTPSLPFRPPPPTTAPISLERRISFNGYPNEENRQKSIANILENRKKNISKLRGLVIPDKVPENDLQGGQKVFDLPVIRSKECDLIKNISTPSTRRTYSDFESHSVRPRTFIRKEFSSLDDDRTKTSPPIKPPRTSLIIGKSTTAATDESDSESYLSSRISSPPISPVAKKPLVRTLSSNSSLSSNSTLTSGSGSQASCSSNGSGSPENRNNNSEAASRKLILASSKSRSGRECLVDKSWRDGDSTDGGIDDDSKQRVSKVKTRSMTNYKLANPSDNLVDKVINVATYVEVISSDSEDKTSSSSSTQKTIVNESTSSIKNDMAKWVRKEASKTETATNVSRTLPKSLEPTKKLNLSEIRKNFEKQSTAPPPPPIMSPRTPTKEKSYHNRYSSWDSIASSSSGVSSELLGTGTGTNNPESLQTNQSDFGSFSSFGSSHSLITPQDLQLIIDEADPPLETSEAFVVVLHRESPESSIGITLAGGSDYEAKEITIHRILANSPADKDGRLKRGDRLLSINGLSMRGLTHRESLSVLKAPRTDVVMVVTRSKSAIRSSTLTKTKLGSLGSLIEKVDGIDERSSMHTSKSIESSLDLISNESNFEDNDLVTIIKDGTGIGISLDGGYDSPMGNKPLIIKKIFMGGAAEKLTNLKSGDEIIEINGLSTEKQSRIDVWNMIKKLPQGEAVQLRIKRK